MRWLGMDASVRFFVYEYEGKMDSCSVWKNCIATIFVRLPLLATRIASPFGEAVTRIGVWYVALLMDWLMVVILWTNATIIVCLFGAVSVRLNCFC